MDPFLHAWDERYHALVSKNLIADWLQPTLYKKAILPYDYTNWTQNHIWLHKQPLSLWLIKLSLQTFGLKVWAVRIPSVLLSTLGILLTYDIARQLYNRSVAFIAASLFTIHGFIIELGSGRVATDHVDVAFMFFILLFAWLAVKYWRSGNLTFVILAGITLGLAILTKWLTALLVIVPIWLLLLYNLKYSLPKIALLLGLLLTIGSIIVLPWQIYIYQHFPAEAHWESSMNTRHFYEVVEHQGGSFFYYFDELRMQFGELIYIPVIWFTYRSINTRSIHDLFISAWFWLPYLFFSCAATKMPAYTLMSAPAIFIITALAFAQLRSVHVAKYSWAVQLVAYAFLLLPVRYSIERIKPFDKMDTPDWMLTIQKVQASKYNTEKCVLFNCTHPIEMMFHTNCTAYKMKPDENTIKELEQKGYVVLVMR